MQYLVNSKKVIGFYLVLIMISIISNNPFTIVGIDLFIPLNAYKAIEQGQVIYQDFFTGFGMVYMYINYWSVKLVYLLNLHIMYANLVFQLISLGFLYLLTVILKRWAAIPFDPLVVIIAILLTTIEYSHIDLLVKFKLMGLGYMFDNHASYNYVVLGYYVILLLLTIYNLLDPQLLKKHYKLQTAIIALITLFILNIKINFLPPIACVLLLYALWMPWKDYLKWILTLAVIMITAQWIFFFLARVSFYDYANNLIRISQYRGLYIFKSYFVVSGLLCLLLIWVNPLQSFRRYAFGAIITVSLLTIALTVIHSFLMVIIMVLIASLVVWVLTKNQPHYSKLKVSLSILFKLFIVMHIMFKCFNIIDAYQLVGKVPSYAESVQLPFKDKTYSVPLIFETINHPFEKLSLEAAFKTTYQSFNGYVNFLFYIYPKIIRALEALEISKTSSVFTIGEYNEVGVLGGYKLPTPVDHFLFGPFVAKRLVGYYDTTYDSVYNNSDIVIVYYNSTDISFVCNFYRYLLANKGKFKLVKQEKGEFWIFMKSESTDLPAILSIEAFEDSILNSCH